MNEGLQVIGVGLHRTGSMSVKAALDRLGFEFVQELGDEQRLWAEESGFARMQTALGTVSTGMFGGRVFDKERCLRGFSQHYEQVRRTVPRSGCWCIA